MPDKGLLASNAASYAYDPIGNRTSSSDGFGNRTYAHNALNEMTTNSLSELVYYADGNLVSDGMRTFAWDAENRLISVTPDSPEDGSLRVGNAYDHLSRRTAKYVERWYASPGEWRSWKTHTFVYDGWNPILETVVNHVAGTPFLHTIISICLSALSWRWRVTNSLIEHITEVIVNVGIPLMIICIPHVSCISLRTAYRITIRFA